MTDMPTTDSEAQSAYVDFAGTAVFYEVEGAGKQTLVLLHGGGPGASSRSNFQFNLPTLGKHYRLLLVDLPGYGRSGPAAGQASSESAFEYYAGAVLAVLDALGVDRAHFIGNSLGGGVAFRFALKYPDRTDCLILMGPAGVNYPVFTPSGQIHQILGDTSSELLRTHSSEAMRRFLEDMVYDRGRITEELVAERLAQLAESDNRKNPSSPIFAMWLGAEEKVVKFNPADFESWRMCPQVEAPTLLVWGRDDLFCPVDGSLYPLQYMPNAQLHVFSRCGHWAQVEHQAEFDAIVVDFIEQAATRQFAPEEIASSAHD